MIMYTQVCATRVWPSTLCCDGQQAEINGQIEEGHLRKPKASLILGFHGHSELEPHAIAILSDFVATEHSSYQQAK